MGGGTVTHALAKGIMVHLGLDSVREGFVCVYTLTTSIKQNLQQDRGTSQLISELAMSQQGEEVKRPEVKAEDLIGAKDKLGSGTEVKSKTFEVMQECGAKRKKEEPCAGKVAPSVFSNVRSGSETAFNKPSKRK
uniref:Musculoskeletal embryonic nuclear protein 1 n=1 Tax=Cyprinus carpio carpio TaxID=630221 RepID=A0A9J7X098_CYPCA